MKKALLKILGSVCLVALLLSTLSINAKSAFMDFPLGKMVADATYHKNSAVSRTNGNESDRLKASQVKGVLNANPYTITQSNTCPQGIATVTYSSPTVQSFTVPAGVTSITIQAYGANGGDLSSTSGATNGQANSRFGGIGAIMRGTFAVTPGDVIYMVVGQKGTGNVTIKAGGGGGTFVSQNNPTFDDASKLLIAAGGGGGGGRGSINYTSGGVYNPALGYDRDANVTTSGNYSSQGTGGALGTGGHGGTDAASGSTALSGGGAGFIDGGINPTGSSSYDSYGGTAPNAGAAGGTSSVVTGSTPGGYGGGGVGANGSGGGGGYSGGGGGAANNYGGGGGSYISGTATSTSSQRSVGNTDGTGNGLVVITWPIACSSPLIPGSIGSNQTICSGNTPSAFTSTADASGGTGTISYQWQSSTDNSSFTDISGATSATYSPGTLNQTTYYRRQASTSADGTVTSNVLTVTVNNLPSVGISPSSTTIVNGNSTTLTASGATTYSWSPSTGLSSTSGSSVTASPTTTTTYTVTGTDANTCVNTATATVTVTNPAITITGNNILIPNGDVTYLTADNTDMGTTTVGTPLTVTFKMNSVGTAPLTVTSILGTGPDGSKFGINGVPTLPATLASGTSATYGVSLYSTTPGTFTLTITVQSNDPANTSYTYNVKGVVIAQLAPGSIGSNQTICSGSTPSAFTSTADASGGTGTISYQWQSSTDNSNFTNISGATLPAYAAGSLTQTTYFRRQATTSANGTVTSNVVTVTVTNPPSLSATATDVTCFNGNNGSIDLTVSGGTTPYQYSWSNGAITEDIAGVPAGSYTVTVTDANSCSATRTVAVSQPATVVNAKAVATPVACYQTPTGSITASANGGTAPYTFSIDGTNYQSSPAFTGIAGGTYTVYAKDAAGCSSSTSVTVSQPSAPITFTTTATNVSCFGSSTGMITVTAAGGSAPYTYSIDGGATYQANAGFTNLPAGTYTIWVKDASACIARATVTITQPSAAVSFTAVPVAATCFGSSTGSVTINAAGGNGSYTYSLNGSRAQSDATFSGLAAGTYSITVTDGNSCSYTGSVTIGQPAAALSLGTSVSNIRCFGSSTGSISVTATGGTAPYTYALNNGTYQSDANFVGLAAATYTVTVQDANGCTASGTATVSQPAAALTLSASVGQISCFGANTGAISLTASGGTSPYSYSIDGGATYQSTPNFTNLAPGTYSVRIKDANNCLTGSTLTITQPASAVSFTASAASVKCYGGSDGSITVTAAGGTPPYDYSINGGSFQSSAVFSGLSSASYTVTVRDANGCLLSHSVSVGQPSQLYFNGGGTNASCPGAADGTITITAHGGTSPYTYSKDNGATYQSSNTFTGLSSGVTYMVVVKDANGCTTTPATAGIGANSAPTISGSAQVCTGASIALTGSGTPASTNPWTSSNTNIATVSNSGVVTGVAAGTVNIVYTNSAGCSVTKSIVVNEAPAPTITADGATTFCPAGSVTLQASPTGSYVYQWYKDGSAISGAVNNSYIVSTSGSYTVTITSGSCTSAPSNAVQVTVQDITAPVAPVLADVTGECSATATAPVAVDDCSGTVTGTTNDPLTYTQQGNYVIHWTFTDAAGNTSHADQNVIVSDHTKPVVNCPATIVAHATTVSGSGYGANVTYAATASDNCGTPTITYSPASGSFFTVGDHTVTVTADDGHGNTAACQFTVTVIAPEINITGNSTDIVDGDNTPSTTDNTDFGHTLPGTPITKTFTIQNTGNDDLHVSGIAISGTDASSFTLGTFSATTLAPGGSTTFTVTFQSGVMGVKNAVITVSNDDYDESSYDYAIQATVDCVAPAFAVCPSNLTQNTDNGLCSAVVNYTSTVSASTNPAASVTYKLTGATTASGSGTGSGSVFNKGVTTVTITASNSCGTATCSFTVTVEDHEKPSITAPSNITVDAGSNCDAVVNLGTPVTGDNCAVQSVTNDAPARFPLGTTTVTWTVTDASGNSNTAVQTVTVEDHTKPVVNCPATIVAHATNVSGSGYGANVTYAATASDNCGTPTITYSPASGSFFTVGDHTVTVTADDGHGNTAACQFTVTVIAPEINITGNSTDIVDGDNTPSTTDNTDFGHTLPGAPITKTFTIQNTGNDDLHVSGIAISGTDASSFTLGTFSATTLAPGGSTTFTVTFQSGVVGVKSAVITVSNDDYDESSYDYAIQATVDCVAPAFAVCPSNLTQNTDNGLCSAVVNYTSTVSASTNPSASVTYKLTGATTASGSGTGSGSVFNKGVTTVTITASNSCGTATCSFTVTVEDHEKPSITAPSNITVDAGSNCDAVVNLGTPVTGDNCAVQSVTNDAPSRFPLGTTTVTWTVTDASGNTNTGVQTVTVEDHTKPVVNCPATIVAHATTVSGSGYGANVTYAATASDNCGTPTLTYSPASGSFFTVGDHTVTVTADDGHGNTSACQFTVTVIAPEINITGNNTDIVDGDTTPSTTDNTDFGHTLPGAPITKTFTIQNTGNDDLHVSGIAISGTDASSFTLGTFSATTLAPGGSTTFTVTFQSGVVGVKSAVITVSNDDYDESSYDYAIQATVDCVAPAFAVCPSNLTQNTDNGLCSAVVSYSASVSASTNPAASVTYKLTGATTASGSGTGSGSVFNKGVTTVTITASNSCGTATCSFTVTVEDHEKPSITAPSNITVDAGANCDAVVNLGTPVTGDNCAVQSVTNDAPSRFPLGTTTVTWTVTDASGNTNTAVQTVTVEDHTKPVVNCPATIVAHATTVSGNGYGANVTYAATASDNCGTPTITYSPASGSFFTVGDHTVTVTADDGHGNTAACQFTVTVIAPEINITGNNTDIVDGDTTPSTTDNTDFGHTLPGAPITKTFTIQNTGNDDLHVSGIAISGTDASSFTLGTFSATTLAPGGSTTFTVTFQSGVVGAKSAVITVSNDDYDESSYDYAIQATVDCVAPAFAVCPSNLTQNTDNGLCSAVVNYTSTVSASTNPSASVTYKLTGATTASGSGTGSGSVFNKGVTTVTITASNSCGTATCTFTVTVEDHENPVIVNLPSNISKSNDPGVCGAVVTWPAVSATDNCPGVTLTSDHNSGEQFPVGTTTVNYTAKDASGNTTTGSFTVTVTDTEKPVFTCPSDIVVTANTTNGQGQAGYNATYSVTASDNCGVQSITYSIPSGSFFPVGNTPVVITVRDLNGNVQTCTLHVIVNCVTPVFTTCPSNKTVNTTTGLCSAVVTYTSAATGTPNASCSYVFTGATTGSGSGNGSGKVFNKGTTTVTITAANLCGSATCTFTVTVEDHENPVIVNLPSNISKSNDPGVCGAVVTWPAVSATDNCGATLTSDHTSGEVFPVGTTTVNYTAKDASGNTSTGSFTVTVTDNEKPVFTCPSDIVVTANTTNGQGQAGYNATYSVTASDNCGVQSITYSIPSGSFFPVGNTPVVITVRDLNGNVQTCTLHVIVNCVTPVFTTCPSNKTVNTTTGLCSAVVTYTSAATGTPNASCSYVFTGATTGSGSGNGSGKVFNKGTTTVTITAANLCGSATCTFTVTVEDHENPVIVNLPSNISKSNDPGVCGAVVTWPAVSATDNCGATLTSDHTSGEVFPVGTTTVNYTARDAAGNTVTNSFTVTVADKEAPVLRCPANVTIACGLATTPANTGTATATDNCGGTVTITYTDVVNGSVTARTWKAVDAAGNVSTCTQQITQGGPFTTSITSVPTSNVYTGANIPSTTLFIGYGAQSTNLQVNTPSGSTYTYVWTGSDVNMLSSTTSASPVFTPTHGGTYTFSVTAANALGCKSSATVSICVTDIRVFATVTHDNDDHQTMCNHQAHSSYDCPHKGHNHYCDHRAHSSYNCPHRNTNDRDDDDQKDCDHQAHYSWDCPHKGHNHYCDHRAHSSYNCAHNRQNVSSDQTVCNHQSHSSYDCSHSGHNHATCNHKAHSAADCPHNGGNGSSDGGDDKKVYICHVPPGSPSTHLTLSVSVNAVADHLANHPGDRLGSCDQQPCTGYTDTEKPVIDCSDNVTVAYGTSTLPAVTGSPEANDNSGDVNISYTDASTQGSNPATASYYNYVITRTWKAADLAGNYNLCSQLITVQDITKPVITDPADITVSCGSTAPAVTGTATATDNSNAVTITYSDVTSGNKIYRTWKATDPSGNYATASQTITISDNVKPVLTEPADITVSCGTSTLPAATGMATATDNCSAVVITYSDVTYGNKITRTWKATDASGNYATDVQIITIVDNTKPVLNVPANITVSCGASTTPSGCGSVATATDNCSTPVVTYSDAVSGNVITRTWKATDASGNYSTGVQTITIIDNIKPVISDVRDITISCSSSTTPSGCGSVATATDNCSTPVVTYSDVTSGNKITRTWKATDAAGNYSTSTQIITLVDNTKPVLTEPNDITISCGSSTLPAVTGNATATDNCSTPVITYTDVVSGNKITRTWKATDAAGNYDTDVQIITLIDNTKPVLTAPSNVTIACGSSNAPSITGAATATDNCSTPVVTYSDAVSGNVTTRTWKATDGSGNYVTAVQTITSIDNVKPVLTVPGNITISCSGSSTPSGCGSVATATDNCSTPVVTYSDVTSGNLITRTWKATDASGNYSTGVQTITIVDNTKPVINAPADITVSCGASTVPSSCGGSATASDNCSTPVITYSDVVSGNKITRTWKATDAAGNYSTDTQIITIVDNTKPVITDVPDVTVSCTASTAPASTGTATATDACSAVTVTYSDAVSGNVITRTWKATDASGNYATSTQVITVGSPFTVSLTSVPTNSTYTGGVSTNLYLGYGAQSTTLSMCSLPSSGAPYTYKWSGSYTNMLNSTTTASPVFTPSTFGYYTFSVLVTNKYGCTSTATISICVTDIRVPGTNGSKVYVCHTTYSGHSSSTQTLQVAISQVASHISSNTCGSNGNDRLGSCDQSPCNTTVTNSTVGISSGVTKEGGVQETEATSTTEEALKVTVMPNPTTTFFTLKLESKYETPVNMRVMDAQGRVIDAKTKIGANSTIQIGHNYSSGTYYAELTQGSTRKVVQMIKGRG